VDFKDIVHEELIPSSGFVNL